MKDSLYIIDSDSYLANALHFFLISTDIDWKKKMTSDNSIFIYVIGKNTEVWHDW